MGLPVTSSLGSVVCVVVVGGLAFVAGERYASRGNAEAVRQADSLQTALWGVEAQHAANDRADAARADSLRYIRMDIQKLSVRLPLAKVRVDTLLVGVVNEGLRDSLTEAIQAEREVSDALLRAGEETERLLNARLLASQDEASRYRLMALEYNRALQAAVRRPHGHLLRDAAFLAGGVLAGFVLSR